MRLRSLPSIEQGRRTEVSFGIWPFAIHYAARRRVLTTRPVATCDDLRLQLCPDDRLLASQPLLKRLRYDGVALPVWSSSVA